MRRASLVPVAATVFLYPKPNPTPPWRSISLWKREYLPSPSVRLCFKYSASTAADLAFARAVYIGEDRIAIFLDQGHAG